MTGRTSIAEQYSKGQYTVSRSFSKEKLVLSCLKYDPYLVKIPMLQSPNDKQLRSKFPILIPLAKYEIYYPTETRNYCIVHTYLRVFLLSGASLPSSPLCYSRRQDDMGRQSTPAHG